MRHSPLLSLALELVKEGPGCRPRKGAPALVPGCSGPGARAQELTPSGQGPLRPRRGPAWGSRQAWLLGRLTPPGGVHRGLCSGPALPCLTADSGGARPQGGRGRRPQWVGRASGITVSASHTPLVTCAHHTHTPHPLGLEAHSHSLTRSQSESESLIAVQGRGAGDGHSTKTENSTITMMPVQSRSTCCRERHGSSSSRRSGSTFTRAM